jgi:dCTP diphosphatase
MDEVKILSEFKRIASVKGWHRFHSTENLSQALMVEMGELLAAVVNNNGCHAIASEIADIQMYLLALADSLDISVDDAVFQKQAYNRQRFEGEES